MLSRFPDFALEPLADHFLPNKTSAGDQTVDWKLIALEYHELSEVILDEGKLKWMEKRGCAMSPFHTRGVNRPSPGEPLAMDEIVSGEVYAYQQEIDDLLEV